MPPAVTIQNRQRTRPVSLPQLRRLTQHLLTALLACPEADLGIYLVAAPEMAQVNETHLQHAGSTDVITFDYGEPGPAIPEVPKKIHGELFICVDEAILQARRFRTTWQAEVMRYIIHGTLHLLGYDDLRMPARRMMKRQENRLLRRLAKDFPPASLAR
ncbi:MAG TPA: rRNA maturation RNase YbeY [Dongiaceae bacterium]|nr:rRNA maturation RNase YbeY [Dongiaceae bacterium]